MYTRNPKRRKKISVSGLALTLRSPESGEKTITNYSDK